jgi:hypothetical protein
MSAVSVPHSRRLVPTLLFAAVLAAAVCLPAQAASWQGKTVEQDGLRQIMNPATPVAAPEVVELEELWRVGGEDDEVLFGVITDIIVDRDGNFYLLDSQLSEIQVYSPGGEHLRTIGRAGEGPGEFRSAFNMVLQPSGNLAVLQAFPSKLVGLTPSGDPADAFSLPETKDTGFKVLFAAQNAGDNLAVVYGFNQPSESGFVQTSILSLFDANAADERRLYSQDSGMSGANPVIAETEWDAFRNRWSAGRDGRVYSAVDFGEYTVNVWKPDGKLAHVIHREYPPHPRTAEQKSEVMEIYKGFTRQIPIPNIKYEVEDDWNPIQRLFARDDGTLWVSPSRGAIDQPKGIVGVYDVFDKDGHYARQVTLKGQGDPAFDGVFFVKDKLFVVTDWLNSLMALQGGAGAVEEDEDAEPMEIICYRLK